MMNKNRLVLIDEGIDGKSGIETNRKSGANQIVREIDPANPVRRIDNSHCL